LVTGVLESARKRRWNVSRHRDPVAVIKEKSGQFKKESVSGMGALIGYGTVLGVVATLAMDIWALILHVVAKQNRPNWRPAGRWFVAVSRGRFLHENIAALEPHRQENLIGWTGHYAVGILYGIVFAAIVGTGWQQAPTFLPAFVFGIVTVGAGWFIMQPGMGLGLAASKTPNPHKVRGLNLAGHTIFALGLYGAGIALAA
jgi:hypothetical protein